MICFDIYRDNMEGSLRQQPKCSTIIRITIVHLLWPHPANHLNIYCPEAFFKGFRSAWILLY